MFPESSKTSSNYVSLKNGDKTIYVKISTLCYIWSNKEKISADRLLRFISAKTKPKHQNFISDCTINTDIFVGDWCLFKNSDSVLIGQVIAFEYIQEKGWRKRYTFNVCPVKPPDECENPKGVNVIANWFLFDSHRKVIVLKGGDFFINIEFYLSHIDPPELIDDKLHLSDKSHHYVKSLMGHDVDPLSF